LSFDTAVGLVKANDFFILSSSCCWRSLLFNNNFLAFQGRVIQISGGICVILHTIAVLDGATVFDSSSELHEN
jgi:hypothetical protein